MDNDNDKYCVFHSGGQGYALPALAIRYVTPTPPVFVAPLTDRMMAGVCHLRNEFLSVVHLNGVARVQDTQPEPRQLVAIASVHGNWGLLVDEVEALAAVEHTTSAESDRRGFAATIIGSATHNGQFLRVLDPNRLYKLVEDRLRAAWAAVTSAQTLNHR